ncbi:unnamed protein product [Parnassius apollo]|uniref:(apollo) hypothetical protein n=1 Tax=Parnassius apollo TaxID=110799 RepID=A0A8S3X958_PARAO|nr:unnamed protein product [Parnassius apollo]
MAENSEAHCSYRQKYSRILQQAPANKILKVTDPSFEEEVYNLLALDRSDNEEAIEDFLISASELMRYHDSDEDEDQRQCQDMIQDQEVAEDESDSDRSDNAPLSDLLRCNYFYGKNKYKWAKTSPSFRVRTPQHNIISSRVG